MNSGNSPRTILIVDDDLIVRKSLASILEDDGWEVFAAQNGSEGLELLGKHLPERIIVDLNLPDMQGEEFIIQSYKIHGNGKYLLHTGDPEYTVPENLKDMGFSQNQVLFKPIIDIQALLEIL